MCVIAGENIERERERERDREKASPLKISSVCVCVFDRRERKNIVIYKYSEKSERREVGSVES